MSYIFIAHREEIHNSCGRCSSPYCSHNYSEDSKFFIFDNLDREEVISEWVKCLKLTESPYNPQYPNEHYPDSLKKRITASLTRDIGDGWKFYVYKNGEKIYDDSYCCSVDDDGSRPNTVWVEDCVLDEDILYICSQVFELTKSMAK